MTFSLYRRKRAIPTEVYCGTRNVVTTYTHHTECHCKPGFQKRFCEQGMYICVYTVTREHQENRCVSFTACIGRMREGNAFTGVCLLTGSAPWFLVPIPSCSGTPWPLLPDPFCETPRSCHWSCPKCCPKSWLGVPPWPEQGYPPPKPG